MVREKFVEGDLARSDEAITDAGLIVVNNSLYFMNTRARTREAVRSMYRALRPGPLPRGVLTL